MRMMASISAVVILLGCNPAPKGKSVAVGMFLQQAESVLMSAGARPVQLDMVDKTETGIIRSYELLEGNVLVVEVSKSDNRVSKLEICQNPDQPKTRRKWNSVQSVTLTKNFVPYQGPEDKAPKFADPQH